MKLKNEVSSELKKYLKKGNFILINNSLVLKLSIFYFFEILYHLILTRFKFTLLKVTVSNDNQFGIIGDKIIRRVSDGQLIVIDSNKIVYRIYKDNFQIDNLINGHKCLEKIFQINPVYFLNIFISKEFFIQGKPLSSFNTNIQNDVFDKIITKYFESVEFDSSINNSNKISFDLFWIKLHNIHLPNDLKEYLNSNRDGVCNMYEKLDWIWNHSDLTPQNILYNIRTNDYKIIDAERCEILPFFYDIFTLMNTYVTMTNNNYCYDSFFSGKYDNYLKKYFDLNDCSNKEYLLIIMYAVKATISWDSSLKVEKKYYNLRWDVMKKYFKL